MTDYLLWLQAQAEAVWARWAPPQTSPRNPSKKAWDGVVSRTCTSTGRSIAAAVGQSTGGSLAAHDYRTAVVNVREDQCNVPWVGITSDAALCEAVLWCCHVVLVVTAGGPGSL